MEDESDSDSSVDEIENQRLREAATCGESIVTECRKKEFESQKNKMPKSLRSSSPVTETNPLNTTPEFRDFVSKKLTELLDRSLKDKKEEEKRQIETYKEHDTGIKLFASSTTVIQCTGEEATVKEKQKPPVVKRRKLSSSTDSSDEEIKLAEAAISVEQIMKESKMAHNGHEIPVQKKNQKTIEKVNESEEQLSQVKKKKKKQKKKKSEIKVS